MLVSHADGGQRAQVDDGGLEWGPCQLNTSPTSWPGGVQVSRQWLKGAGGEFTLNNRLPPSSLPTFRHRPRNAPGCKHYLLLKLIFRSTVHHKKCELLISLHRENMLLHFYEQKFKEMIARGENSVCSGCPPHLHGAVRSFCLSGYRVSRGHSHFFCVLANTW